jgi:tetratricopeptide (TPR) repeat protein
MIIRPVILLGFILVATFSKSFAAGDCPPAVPIPGQFGPFDYNNPDNKGQNLHIVETMHFTPQVEQLIRGQSGYVGGDLDYTLRAFPNHPRALNAMARLALQEKTPTPRGAHFSVECYFNRAMDFVPTDPVPYLLYGNYLAKSSREQEALEKYQQAEKIDPQNANVLYNMGLLYFNMKQYDQSLTYAKKAYAAGFPLPGLRQKLESAGQWKED